MHMYFSSFFQVRRVKPLLTVTFLSGDISLMNNYDDLSPAIIRSGLKGKIFQYDNATRYSFQIW